jgi:hypothetical protein
LDFKNHVFKTQGSCGVALLTQAQGRQVETNGQPHCLTALFQGKNIPHWPLDVGS